MLRYFTRQNRKQLGIGVGRFSKREKKHLPGEWIFIFTLIAKPEIYSHLASWRVVNRTQSINAMGQTDLLKTDQ
jgi:hypothetical protein